MLKLRFDRYINVRNTPTSRTMNLKLCKFPRVLLTRFPLVQRQSATVTAHTRAQSWHSPFKTKYNSLFYKMILITKTNPTPFEEISLQELNKLLQKFYLSARKIVARGCSEQGSFLHEHARPLNKRCAWRLTTGFAIIIMARLKAIIAIILLIGLGECARDLTKCVVCKKKL